MFFFFFLLVSSQHLTGVWYIEKFKGWWQNLIDCDALNIEKRYAENIHTLCDGKKDLTCEMQTIIHCQCRHFGSLNNVMSKYVLLLNLMICRIFYDYTLICLLSSVCLLTLEEVVDESLKSHGKKKLFFLW